MKITKRQQIIGKKVADNVCMSEEQSKKRGMRAGRPNILKICNLSKLQIDI